MIQSPPHSASMPSSRTHNLGGNVAEDMESLLRWGIEHSSGERPEARRDLDPAIIDYILGKPDAQLMKEALDVALDVSKDDGQRILALDDLEMLVESIDNANDLQKLKMWEPLHGLVGLPSTTDSLRLQTLWVLGTALQNNPAAQLSYLSLDPIPAILACLSPSSNSPGTRSKAMYALSGLLKHNAAAVRRFSELQGWNALRNTLEDSEIALRRRSAFLVNTLLTPTSGETSSTPASVHTPSSTNAPVHPNSHASMLSDPASVSTSPTTMQALQTKSAPDGSSLLDAFISALAEPVPFGADGENERDTEFRENIVRLLHTYSALCGGRFSDVQKHSLHTLFDNVSSENNLFGLGREEFGAVKTAISE